MSFPLLDCFKDHKAITRVVGAALKAAQPGAELKDLVASARESFPIEDPSYDRMVELTYNLPKDNPASLRTGSRISRIGRAIKLFLGLHRDREAEIDDAEAAAAARAMLETVEPELAAYVAGLPGIREVRIEAWRTEGAERQLSVKRQLALSLTRST